MPPTPPIDHQKEFRQLLDTLIAAEDERDKLRRKAKRLRAAAIRVFNQTLPRPIPAGWSSSKVKDTVALERRAEKCDSEAFSAGLRARRIERHILANYR